jgi:hypothetical protein
MMVYKLPEWEGYTIDSRLREFRRVGRTEKGNFTIEFVPFTSIKGRKLLKKIRGVV